MELCAVDRALSDDRGKALAILRGADDGVSGSVGCAT